MKINRYLQSSPVFSSYLASEKLFIPFQKKLKSEGLTFIQSMILSAIYFEKQPITPSQLANTLMTSPSNISHSLKILKKGLLIKKSHSKKDERKVHIELTNKGSKKVLKLIKTYDLIQTKFEQEFSEKKINLWNKNTRKLIHFFENEVLNDY